MSLPPEPTGRRPDSPGQVFVAPVSTVSTDPVAEASLDAFRVSMESTCTRQSSTDQEFPDGVQVTDAYHANRLSERFQLVERIGKGGFGEVWKAYDRQRRQYVAIKGPRPDRPVTAKRVRSFLSEAQKARQLARFRVVPVLDVVEVPTQSGGEFLCFVVMKLMTGGSLTQRLLQEPRPPLKQVVRWIASLADTLAEIHAQGYIHRDIKPDNILFDERGRPHFSDFGLAVSVEEQLGEQRHVLGTVSYMAPEQARRQHVDRQADIYSLGVVLYQMLALPHVSDARLGLPYLARSTDEYLESLGDPNQHARALPTQVPQPLAAIVEQRCVCDDKTRRYRVASELSRDLRAWLRSTGRSRIVGTVLASVLLLVLAGGSATGFLALGGSPWSPGAEDKAIRSAGEALGPRQLESGTWNRLLDRPLRKLTWTGAGDFEVLQPHYDLEELTVGLQGIGLLQAGSVLVPDYRLRLRIRQPGWTGKFGVFYGLQPRGEGYVCERLRLERWSDRQRRPTFTLYRDELRLDETLTLVECFTQGSQRVDMPDQEVELTLAIQGGAVHSVTWNGMETPEILLNGFPDLPPVDCRGGLGLYVERGTITALQFRVFPEDQASKSD